MMRQRKTPIRTCIACRTSGDKKALLRIVRTSNGEVVVDPTGKMPGRGAYICPTRECLKKAVKEKKLSRALRKEVTEETLKQLKICITQGSEE